MLIKCSLFTILLFSTINLRAYGDNLTCNLTVSGHELANSVSALLPIPMESTTWWSTFPKFNGMAECLEKIASDSPTMSYKVDKIITIDDNGEEIDLDYNYRLEIEARNGSHSPIYLVYASAPLFFGQGLKVYKTENQIKNICGPIDPSMSSCGCRCDKTSLESQQEIDNILDINPSYDTPTMVHVPFYNKITLHLSGKQLESDL